MASSSPFVSNSKRFCSAALEAVAPDKLTTSSLAASRDAVDPQGHMHDATRYADRSITALVKAEAHSLLAGEQPAVGLADLRQRPCQVLSLLPALCCSHHMNKSVLCLSHAYHHGEEAQQAHAKHSRMSWGRKPCKTVETNSAAFTRPINNHSVSRCSPAEAIDDAALNVAPRVNKLQQPLCQLVCGLARLLHDLVAEQDTCSRWQQLQSKSPTP